MFYIGSGPLGLQDIVVYKVLGPWGSNMLCHTMVPGLGALGLQIVLVYIGLGLWGQHVVIHNVEALLL